MKRSLFLILIGLLLIAAPVAAATDPNSGPAVQQPAQAIVTLTGDNITGSGSNVDPGGIMPSDSALQDIKKLIPQGAIFIYTWSSDALPYLGESVRQLLAKNKIGTTISDTLRDNYYELMKRRMGPYTRETYNRFVTECAREVGGYLFNVRLNYIGQEYKVITEYELIDVNHGRIVCSNSLQDHYGWWSPKHYSDTAMIDSSLNKMVKDLLNQLKKQKSDLVHK